MLVLFFVVLEEEEGDGGKGFLSLSAVFDPDVFSSVG